MHAHAFTTLLLVVPLALSCAPPLEGRRTTATIAQSDDPWLMGERCTPDTPAEPALRIDVVAEGEGAPVGPGATVRVHYVASLPNGKVIHDSDRMPSEIVIGSTRTICGFERSLLGMRPGEQRRVIVPWQLGFGAEGRSPEIPPRTDLTFVIDLYLPAEISNEHGAPPVNPIRGGGRRR